MYTHTHTHIQFSCNYYKNKLLGMKSFNKQLDILDYQISPPTV